ncbi:MAG TPA: hypothetical protein VHJ78_07810 [Actinomycetota bacterium]|nr:hypothetical protein [Actinomycetota bacterium]
MFLVTSGPADATPLQSVTASASGLEATGLLTVPKTPNVTTTFPPAARTEDSAILEVPLGTLVFAGVAETVAQTVTDTTLAAALPADRLSVRGGGALPAAYNAKGHARIAGVSVASSVEIVEGIPPLTASLISVGAVEAEALVSCVAGRPVVVAGSRLIGPLNIAGLDIAVPVDNLTNQVVELTGALAGILELRRNVIEDTPNGVRVIALQVRVLETGLVVNLAEASVAGSACADVPECRDGIDNDGDGRIDFPNDPQCKSLDDDSEAPECSNAKDDDGDGKIDRGDPGCYHNGRLTGRYDPNDDTEADLLPRTGGDGMLLGLALLAAGGAMMVGRRRIRRMLAD